MGARLVYVDTLEDDDGDEEVDALSWVAGERSCLAFPPDRTVKLQGRRNPFFGMPYAEAIEHFLARKIVTPEEFDELEDRYKSAGFIARKLASDAQVRRIRDLVLDRLYPTDPDDAVSEQDVADVLRSELGDELAVPDHYLRLVARNAVSTSYMAGRWGEMNRPSALKLRPYAQYLTARDGRVRDAHRALDGMVVELGTDFAGQIAPPIDQNCRCALRTLTESELASRGLIVATEWPEYSATVGGREVTRRARPGEGWEAPPDVLAAFG